MKTIGIDIGGSKIAIGVCDEGKILHRITLENTFFKNPHQMTDLLISNIEMLLQIHNSIGGIGVGSPGWVIDGTVYEAVNLGIPIFPLREELASRLTSLPIFVENDARTALLAELRFGALQGCTNGAMITFGTGIGGGLVINGKPFYGSFGYAGEVGHLTLGGMGNEKCPCGKNGCFELYASVTALLHMAKIGGLNVKNGKDFFTLAQEGNECALNILDNFTENASKGIVELAMLLDLDTIAIGGGISSQQNLFIEPICEKAKTFAPKCKIVQAVLGNDAGIIGAALFVQESVV